MPSSAEPPLRQGAIAVVWYRARFLVIRRSQWVEAPGTYCFPGGGIEPGESPQDAVRRELREELSVESRPQRELWQSVTSWRVALTWWQTRLDSYDALQPNPAEVEQVLWLSAAQMLALPALLPSNRQFLEAGQRGVWQLD